MSLQVRATLRATHSAPPRARHPAVPGIYGCTTGRPEAHTNDIARAEGGAGDVMSAVPHP